MTRQEEFALVQRIRGGDSEAFAELMAAHEKTVYNLALRMLGNPQDAEDMTQETFLKAYNSLEGYRGDSKFSVWLYRIASNVCLDFLRRQKRRPSISLTVEDDDGEDVQIDIPDLGKAPEQELEKRLTREAVQRGLEQLPPDARQILLLREIRGLSYEEIGQVLDLEPGTVKSRIFRARKKLCAFLLADGNIPDDIASKFSGGGETP